MEEIFLTKGDSSDVYEFLSKEIPVLDDAWEASWAISLKLGDPSILSGVLSKNTEILNADNTVKTPANSFFIFQITPEQSESLAVGKYILGVEIRQINTDGVILFRNEVMQNKLIIKEQAVL